jgi:hypothetical protein
MTGDVQARSRTTLAWLLFVATFGCLAAGLAVTLTLVRPLTVGVLATGALGALLYLGFAITGLVLSLRRPANPIGWLYAASGLVWSLTAPLDPWVGQLVHSGRPLPLAAQLNAAVGESNGCGCCCTAASGGRLTAPQDCEAAHHVWWRRVPCPQRAEPPKWQRRQVPDAALGAVLRYGNCRMDR